MINFNYYLNIPYKGKNIIIDYMDYDYIIKHEAKFLCNNVPKYINHLGKLLKESALNYGIDPDNHSVDSDKSKDLGKNLPLSQ